MNSKDVVTTFSLEEKETGKGVTISSLIRALNEHARDLLKGESFCDRTQWDEGRKDERIPARFRALIAFVMEGDSEGWYVHIGAMVDFSQKKGTYIDFGHAKMWSAEEAYALGIEAQKFLTAARCN